MSASRGGNLNVSIASFRHCMSCDIETKTRPYFKRDKIV